MQAKFNPNPQMPGAGSFHAWKRVRDAAGCFYLLYILIPKEGDAVQACESSALSRGKYARGSHTQFCRAPRVKTVSAHTTTGHNTSKTEFWSLDGTEYFRVGEFTSAEAYDGNPYHKRGAGITFYMTLQLAKENV